MARTGYSPPVGNLGGRMLNDLMFDERPTTPLSLGRFVFMASENPSLASSRRSIP